MSDRPAKRVMLIGWDAADWQFITPLLEAGMMPHLAGFIEEGCTGNIATLRPVLSPMLWNSIATGKGADKHRILGFIEPDGLGGTRPVTSTSRKAKAVWNILSQNGLKSSVINWFASHPAEKINGCIVSDRFTAPGNTEGRPTLPPSCVHPEHLQAPLDPLRIDFHDLSPEQLLPFVPRAAEIDQEKDKRLWQLAGVLAECATVHNAATFLAEHEPWDLLAVYYNTIDHFGHGFMRFHPPRQAHVSESDFEIYKDVMTGCYRFHDMMLGRLLQLAGPDTTVIILSDHGFHHGELRPAPAQQNGSDAKTIENPEDAPLAWHRSHGILAVRGPGIRRDQLIHGASLLDITPTILHMLGLPVAKDMEGETLSSLFVTPSKVRFIESYEPPHEFDGVYRGEFSDDPYSAQAAMQQLVDLGYVEAPSEEKATQLEQLALEQKRNLFQVHFHAQRLEEALAIARELLEGNDIAFNHARMAMCLNAMRRHAEAAPHALIAFEREPDVPMHMLIRARTLFLNEEYEEAFRLCELLLETDAKVPEIHLHMGNVHLAKQRWEDAGRCFQKAIEIDPDNAAGHHGLGVSLANQGNLEDALAELMRTISLDHSRAPTHIALGDVLVRLRQTEWAIRAYTTAAELSPLSPRPHRRLARLLMNEKRDMANAMTHMRTARQLARNLRSSRKPVG